MSEMNSSGRIDAFTTAGAASAFGTKAESASASAANVVAPTASESANAGSVRAGHVHIVEQRAHRDHDRDQQHRDQHHVPNTPKQECPRWQRRAPQPLQQPLIARDRYAHRETRVAGVHDRERRNRGDVEGGDVCDATLDLQLLVAEQQVEDHEEDEREGEGEECRRRVTPERAILVAQLPQRQRCAAHSSRVPSAPGAACAALVASPASSR